jgi:hypothetical protein
MVVVLSAADSVPGFAIVSSQRVSFTLLDHVGQRSVDSC